MSIDVSIMNAAVAGVSHLFAEVLKMPLVIGKPQLRPPDWDGQMFALTVAIDIGGPVCGQVGLSFSAPVARAVVAAVQGSPVAGFDEQSLATLLAATREIAAAVRTALAPSGATIDHPRACRRTHRSRAARPVVMITMDSPAGRLVLDFEVESGAARHAPPLRPAA